MAKNIQFKRRYTIEVKGITTNRFMEKFLDCWLGRMMKHSASQFAQLEIVTMTAEEIETAKKVREIFKCPKCKAMKYTEGSTCLFCASEEDHNADSEV